MNLLKKIQQINSHKGQSHLPELDNSAFAIPEGMSLADLFKREVEKVGGHACLCTDEQHLLNELRKLFGQAKWHEPFAFAPWAIEILQKIGFSVHASFDELERMDVGVGICEYLVAWTGSVVVSSALPGGRRFNIFSPDLVILARREQLVLDPDQALVNIHSKYDQAPSQITLVTGPSKTADIEKTLIYGMHGPRSLYVFIL